MKKDEKKTNNNNIEFYPPMVFEKPPIQNQVLNLVYDNYRDIESYSLVANGLDIKLEIKLKELAK